MLHPSLVGGSSTNAQSAKEHRPMALEAILDTIDDLPDAVKAEYEAKDGKFVLQVNGIKTHPDVTALQNAHERTKTELRAARTERDAFKARVEFLPDDFDAEAFQALQARADANKEGGDLQQRLEAQRALLDKQWQKKLDESDSRANELERELHSRLIDDDIRKSLVEQGVKRDLLEGAVALIKTSAKPNVVKDEKGFQGVIDDGIDEKKKIPDYVKEWAKSDIGKAYVEKPNGGGSTGGNGTDNTPNPFGRMENGKRVGLNRTQAQELYKTNREQALRLAAAAGFEEIKSWQ
jgi:hypothetical protein